MPSIRCRCGEILRYGEIPCREEWLLISDVDFDKLTGPINPESIYQTMTSFLKCPHCERLWVFWNGFATQPKEYAPYPVQFLNETTQHSLGEKSLTN